MLSVSLLSIIYLFALENGESALIGSPSNSYIKNKLRNTKELIDIFYSLPRCTHNNNITIASRNNFNEMIGKENGKEFWNKNRGASALFNFNDKIIFIKSVKKFKKLVDYRINLNIEKNWLSMKKVYLERGKADSCLIGMSDENTIAGPFTINPVELKIHIREKEIFFKNEKGFILSGAITFNGLVNVQEISINNLKATYLLDKKVEHLLISEVDQSFSKELSNLKDFIKNLQLNSICELTFKYWLRDLDGSEKDLRNINLNNYPVYNETVMSVGKVKSTYRVEEININKINGIDIKNVVKSSFLLGNIQSIRGSVSSEDPFRVMDLRVGRINNISSARLLNKVKNEKVEEIIAVDRLKVQYLLVDKINEVIVSEAARMSRENMIKGKVRITNLFVINEVKVQENVVIPLNNSMQAYEEVLIVGKAFIKNVQIEKDNCIAIALQDRQVGSNEALEQSWRKSDEQMISQRIGFKKGATINELACQYLNGLREQEFAYLDCTSLNIGNISFNDGHVLGEASLMNENRSAGGFFKKFSSSSSIVFDRSVRFKHLSADRLLIDRYNGIPVNDIMQPSNFPPDFSTHFRIAVRASEQMHVRQLSTDSINLRSAKNFQQALRSDRHLKIDKVRESPGKHGPTAIKMNTIEIKALCGRNVEGGLLNQQILVKKRRLRENIVFTLAGKLQVETSFNVINRSLNEEEPEHYDIYSSLNVDKLDKLIERKRIKRMDVFEHLNVQHLLMRKLQSIFAEALTVHSQQLVSSGQLIAEHVNVEYLSIEALNTITASSLILHTAETWRSLINGSKYFSSLVVVGNIRTKSLKGESAVTRTTAKPLKIRGAMLNNQSVHIFGFVFWDDRTSSSSTRSESVKKLFDNAASKSTYQSSVGSLVVDQATAVDYLEIVKDNLALALNKILETLSDSLIDREDSTAASAVSEVTAKKMLKRKVQARIANVLKSIRTRSINRLRFDQIVLQLFRKSNHFEALENPMTLSKLSFLCELEIESLRTQSSSRRSARGHQFALVDKKTLLCSRLTFKRLVVQRNVSLLELDKLEFNKFLTNRINILHFNDIIANVKFHRSVIVLASCSIVELNAVRENELVFKIIKASALPARASTVITLIKGKKSFSSILYIESNLDVMSLASHFNDSFFNADNIEIFGNLEIEEDTESLSDILLLGQLNNTGLEFKGEKGESSIQQSRKIVTYKVREINELAAVEPKNKLSGGLFYFEKVNNFNIHWPTGIQSVTSQSIDDSSTRLDLYISEGGTFCGLPIDNCPCRAHLLLEISLSGKERVLQAKRSNVLFNFYQLRASLGLRVISQAGETGDEAVESVRSGEQCTRHEAAVATIFWTKLNTFGEVISEKAAVRIEGFIADAQVFLMNNDKLYMILAKFYDNTLRSYSTDSIVYEFDLKSKTVNKCQLIATEGAKVLHVFQVAKSGVYAFIGCVKGKAESLLMRFDPVTRQFQLIRTFITGGGKHIASLSNENKTFVILSNPDIEALQIYIYNVAFDNFYHYQNLYFQSRVSSLNILYTEDFGHSNLYFTVTTKDDLFCVYQYTFSGKFQMIISHRIEDFQLHSPFHIGNKNYLFATHKYNSTIFKTMHDDNY